MIFPNYNRGGSGGCCHCSNRCPYCDHDDFFTAIVRAAFFLFILLLILSAM